MLVYVKKCSTLMIYYDLEYYLSGIQNNTIEHSAIWVLSWDSQWHAPVGPLHLEL